MTTQDKCIDPGELTLDRWTTQGRSDLRWAREPGHPDEGINGNSIGLLREYILNGARQCQEFSCGLELECIGFNSATLTRLNSNEVQAILCGLASDLEQIEFEDGVPIRTRIRNGGDTTVEPGGQIEYSSTPRKSLRAIETETQAFLNQLNNTAGDVAFLGIGFDPFRSADEQFWYPKKRYAIMRPYLASRGGRGGDMMCRTSAIQVNLDFESEEDLAKKFIAGNRLAPIVTAMFANSPFDSGALSGYKSTRAAVWMDTDPARTGLSLVAVDGDFSVDRFIDYALDVPMFLVKRQGHMYGDVAGTSFSNFLASGLGTLKPLFRDWPDHLSTIFTEARLKQYIELRCMDGNSLQMAMAACAFWKGLFYHRATLDDALRLTPRLNGAEWYELRQDVARYALESEACGVDVLSLARELVTLARCGLEAIARDELRYLEPLEQLVQRDGLSPADILIRNWEGGWNKQPEKLIEHLRLA